MGELTQARLKELLHYDPESGIFTWKETTSKKIKAGDIAGCFKPIGHVYIGISGKNYYAHRLAWLYMDGFLPKNIGVDHIDRNPRNNKWANLRLASQQCNSRNCGTPKDNTSGVKGVSWCIRGQKWRAHVSVSGKYRSLGYYESFDNAVCARLAAEQALNWEGCDSSSPAYKYVMENIQNVKKY